MGQKSEGKPNTQKKAKTASPRREQTQAQPLQDPPTRSRSRNWKPTSAMPDERDEMDSQAIGSPEDSPNLARYEYDQQPQEHIEHEVSGREDVSIQEENKDRHHRIAEHAFLLYTKGGFQHGYDLDHWLEAERDIMKS